MRVMVSVRYSSPGAAHGGPIMARRHAQALAAAGAEVFLVAPEPPQDQPATGIRVLGYEMEPLVSSYLEGIRPNPGASRSFARLLQDIRPDVVYDVAGPAWPLDVAQRQGIPTASTVCDYTWFCARAFLVDVHLQRCTGPETLDKCFRCETHPHRTRRKVVQEIFKYAHLAGLPDWPDIRRLSHYRFWSYLAQARDYRAQVLERIACFIIGDEQAYRYFRGHGVPDAKIVRLPQALPADALQSRRVEHQVPASFDAARPLRLGYVGRLDPEKGFHVLARAFDGLADDGAPLELSVIHVHEAVPDRVRPLFPDGKRFDAWLASGKLRLVRPHTKAELFSTMASMDLGVVPSIAYESPCLAMMEFAAQGTPVLRSESDGMSHVIQDGINGRTFPYGDADALRGLIQAVLARSAVIGEWRRRLPQIKDDSTYGAALFHHFSALAKARSVVSTPSAGPRVMS